MSIKKFKRISLVTIGAFLLFLIVTNPSLNRFKEFDNWGTDRRVSNYIIFSIFETKYKIWNHEDHYVIGTQTDKYIGIAFNFYKIDN